MDGSDDIEMQPMGSTDCGCTDGEQQSPTHQAMISTATAPTSQRVKRNYLSMIFLAYVLTILSPATVLWSPSSVIYAKNTTTSYASMEPANGTAMQEQETHQKEVNNIVTGQQFDRSSIVKCVYGSSINISVLAKLTCYTTILILLFFNLHGSNPGMLTKDAMTQLDEYETKCNATTTHGLDFEEERLERESFLEPLPLTPTKHLAPPQSMPQSKHQKLYPHTRRKYCTKCCITPPLRSHHCNICGCCVATFDHHCLFLDTCIGERNHFRFWLFVLVNVICFHVALGIVGTSQLFKIRSALPYDYTNGQGDVQLVMRVGQAILILAKLYMYPLYCVVTILWIIHTTFALGNCTTFEMTKGSEHIDYLRGTKVMDFPFGKGLLQNVMQFISRDDLFNSSMQQEWCFVGRLRRLIHLHCSCFKAEKATKSNDFTNHNNWLPILWKMPVSIDRESEDWWNHPWQNKYWACC